MWIPFPRVSWGRPTLSAEEEQQARIDAKLRAIERQGAGSVLFAHGLAYLLVVAFSAGALITLAGDAINHFITQAQQGVFDFPSFVSFVVSFVLVFAMDTAMMIAAFHVRMLNQRQQEGAWKHMVVIVVVSLVESATYLDMGYLYDHPASWVTWAILGVRALLSPGIAVYLSLSRTLPVTARDINTQVENVTGRGVLVEMTRIADDPASTTERKVALYRASAVMDGADKSRLDAIIEAERATRDGAAAGAAAAPPSPTLPAAPAAPAKPLSRHDQRRLELEASQYTDLEEYPADDYNEWDDDGPSAWRHVTAPRQQPAMNTRMGKRANGASAARIAPQSAALSLDIDPLVPSALELALELPVSKYEQDDDSDQRRAVFRVLDQALARGENLNRKQVAERAGVNENTVRTARTSWDERRAKRIRRRAAPSTVEMPAVTADMPQMATSAVE